MPLLSIYTILYGLAALCFLIFAAAHPPAKINLLGLGIFFWSLVPLIQTIHKL